MEANCLDCSPGRYHGCVTGPPQLWLGIDVGTRRIGVALSNALGIAQPLLTFERTQPRRDQRSILRLARRHGCTGIIVGNPLHLSGHSSRQTERVHRFVDELKALILEAVRDDAVRDEVVRDDAVRDDADPDAVLDSSRGRTSDASASLPDDPLVPESAPPSSSRPVLSVHLWDERLSTAEAHQALDETGRAQDDRRAIIDQLAASIILQGWLDAQRGSVTLLPPDP
jgi:putative Holliday junction resolvase